MVFPFSTFFPKPQRTISAIRGSNQSMMPRHTPECSPASPSRSMSGPRQSSDICASAGCNEAYCYGSFADSSAHVRKALAQDIAFSTFSRSEIAQQLSNCIGRHISVAMIDAFIAETKPHRFPAELIPAWVKILGSDRVLRAVCAEAGLSLATEEDREFAELGRTRLRDEKLTRRLWERVL